ncbi:DUF6062 family protein [Paenibacillus thermotolerans]|uniref:DUF6062 family protein n=1 Tax=Paenibacillus thermotolerans TaxID=3027807 RepID=UPI002367BFFE|nr:MULTISPECIES: DUF6062 family protein [unclassified Paenibacillus]
MDKHIMYHDLKDALRHGVCPICSLVEQRVERTIKVILREGYTDSALRSSYRQAKGYCNRHAWQMREAGDPIAHAVMYRGLLEEHRASLEAYMNSRKGRIETSEKESTAVQRIRAILQGVKHASADDGRFAETRRYLDSFSSDKRCPLCEVAESCEARYVEAALDYYEGDEDFKEKYRNRGILCHPHLRRLIRDHGDRTGVEEMMEIQLGRLDLYIEHLSDMERKASLRYSEDPNGDDRGGWLRAIQLDVGSPGIDTSYKTKAAAIRESHTTS